MTEPKISPYSQESEQAFLCSLILWPELLYRCDTLSPMIFFLPAHATIFKMLIEVGKSDQVLDFFLCKEWLKKNNLLEEIGGADYLNDIWQFVPTGANWEYYLDILKDRHLRRQTIQGCQAMLQRMYDISDDASGSIREYAESTLTQMVTDVRPKAREWPNVVDEAVAYLEKKSSNEGMEGVLFNIMALDTELAGIRRGEYAVICANVSVGKTALAMQGALNTVIGGGVVAMFSFEMSAVRMALRMLSQLGKVRMGAMRTKLFTDRELSSYRATAKVLRNLKIRMEDSFSQNINGLISRCRQLHAKEPLELVVVDYLQLVTPATFNKSDNREREVADISRKLKNLAGELDVTVIALSQLNEQGKMRESRSISQDADIILRLDAEEGSETFRNVSIDKNRDGPRGKIFPVTFEGQYVTFTDAPVENHDQPAKKNWNGNRNNVAAHDR